MILSKTIIIIIIESRSHTEVSSLSRLTWAVTEEALLVTLYHHCQDDSCQDDHCNCECQDHYCFDCHDHQRHHKESILLQATNLSPWHESPLLHCARKSTACFPSPTPTWSWGVATSTRVELKSLWFLLFQVDLIIIPTITVAAAEAVQIRNSVVAILCL